MLQLAFQRARLNAGFAALLQEVRENAERKEHDKNSEWAKPTNKNPLEKTGAAHGIGGGGE